MPGDTDQRLNPTPPRHPHHHDHAEPVQRGACLTFGQVVRRLAHRIAPGLAPAVDPVLDPRPHPLNPGRGWYTLLFLLQKYQSVLAWRKWTGQICSLRLL